MEAEPTTTLQPNSANSEPENNNNSSNSKNVTLSSNSNSKYPSSSKLLEDVVLVPNSSTSSNPLDQTSGFQGQSGMSRQEALADATGKAAQTRPQMQLTESLIKPLLKEKDEEQEVKKRNSTCCTDEPSDDAPKTPISDVYCWRKYGQKQVKSSGSSRSYYRCTYLSCCAKKKVQHLDVSGKIIDVVYKGVHNHDPPQILKGSSRKKDFATRVLNNSSVQSLKSPRSLTCETELNQLVPMAIECQDINLKSAVGTPSRDAEDQHTKTIDSITRPENELVIVPAVEEPRGLRSDRSNQHVMINPMKVLDVAPLKKRRIKEGGKACSESVYRTFKNPKIVVHTAGDVAKFSDGYRWRKYGQKIVKGNLHPRSYYRCSSTGCPVRKHVERATDNSTAIIVTYEGKHDHDVPLPKRHQPHASPNSTACGPNMLLETSDIKSLSQGSAEERSKDMDCDIGEEKASEPGRDKVLEPARMLLSIGVELKSC